MGKQEKSCNSETELADESVGGWRRLSGIKGRSNRERERERNREENQRERDRRGWKQKRERKKDGYEQEKEHHLQHSI